MKLSDQVTSLKLSKRLKELKCPQESLWYWHRIMYDREDFDRYELQNTKIGDPDNAWKGMYKDIISAPTVAELGKILPARVKIKMLVTVDKDKKELHDIESRIKMYKADGKGFVIGYGNEKPPYGDGNGYWLYNIDTEANARAEMVIHLRENKLIPSSG